jgi:predicted DNA binding protein
MKKDNFKEKLIEQLKKVPIIQISCERTNIARSSFYRWRAEDKKFAKKVDMAILEGEALITDMSESQLISLIHDRNFQALQLWLRHHHPKYNNKVEVIGHLNMKEEPLTPEQEKLVKKALGLAGLLENKQTKKNNGQDITRPTK